MTESCRERCADCGGSVLTFVRHGSFFTRCVGCGASGPAASWLDVCESLPGRWRAYRSDAAGTPIALVAEGDAAGLRDAVRAAAGDGAWVCLVAEGECRVD
ncbi:MAG: hypothetical protein KDJ14_15925 [Xanthomonadales bacterium]|nr:hypothetical protein [Xanthomonadales bacterium]